MRWIWIDRFEEFVSRKSAKAVKLVSVAEDHVHEQYPGYPIMPHSLIIEGLAQTGGILVGEANNFTEKVVLAKIPHVRFHGHAIAGDRLDYEVQLQELRPEGAIVSAKVLCNGALMAEGEIVFAHLDQSRASDDELAPKNFVFTKDHLIALLRMAKGTYQEKLDQGANSGAANPVSVAKADLSTAGNNGRP